MRYFLIDRITEYSEGESAAGVKNVTLTDEVLHDHFPDYPVMPGALVIEALAQLSGFLLEMTYNKPGNIRRALLAQIDNAKFHRPAEPGDRLELHSRVEQRLGDAVKVSAEAAIEGEKAVRASLTFVMKELDSEKVHEQRRYLYKLWTKNLDRKIEIL